MEMQQVRYFLALSRTLNFTRAAEQSNVSQPALTRAIQQLEHELGGPLFHRERAKTHLSELGRIMLPYLESIHDQAQAARVVRDDITFNDIVCIAVATSLATEKASSQQAQIAHLVDVFIDGIGTG